MKKLNLLGIRNKVILCRTKSIGEDKFTVMRAIDERQEKELDTTEQVVIDGRTFSRKSIYVYGEINLSSKEDVNTLNKLRLMDDTDKGNLMHSGFSYVTGEVEYDTVVKYRTTWDAIEWFKYNHCLLGKPKRIVIYECTKSSL